MARGLAALDLRERVEGVEGIRDLLGEGVWPWSDWKRRWTRLGRRVVGAWCFAQAGCWGG